MNEAIVFFSGIMLGILVASFLFVIVLGARDPKIMEKEAIAHKAGYYHPETGEFMWVNDK